jgi:hypothetical protein
MPARQKATRFVGKIRRDRAIHGYEELSVRCISSLCIPEPEEDEKAAPQLYPLLLRSLKQRVRRNGGIPDLYD